ncbi:TPA: hypothetical protein QDA90_005886 [Burkholderia vietnamiensis]|uniref:hypothetical protein n=1 Tax=Burkholderia vietnamiensis TaxID=60552 RepID=UPI00298B28D7|nr:hypothetical protein [Burkholderia vietnamiensis]
MKKQFLLITLAVACHSAFAATEPEVQDAAQRVTPAQLAILHQDLQQIAGELVNHQASELVPRRVSQDPFSFCYFKNEAYSLGAVRDGLVCEDTGVHMRTSEGAIDRNRSDPLRWIPVSPKARRSNG